MTNPVPTSEMIVPHTYKTGRFNKYTFFFRHLTNRVLTRKRGECTNKQHYCAQDTHNKPNRQTISSLIRHSNLSPNKSNVPADKPIYPLLASQAQERERRLALPHRRVRDNGTRAASGFEIEPAFRHVYLGYSNRWAEKGEKGDGLMQGQVVVGCRERQAG
jgi:hypothetical protein